MDKSFDLVIRGGVLFDGSGAEGVLADVAIRDGIVAQVGHVSEDGIKEIDATGKIVTPGFVDIHTHYDGQVTWDQRLAPSSGHGVTTVVMGNCGVGFAPCRESDHDKLISLMEGVEDIPHPVLSEGLAWNWESFEDYLDVLDSEPRDIDFACQIPHGPLRVFVMGERGANREAATEEDLSRMSELVQSAIKAGALGFSTSRTLNHKTSEGSPTPSYEAADTELETLAMALKEAGSGVFQLASDFAKGNQELALLERMMDGSGRPVIFSLSQHMIHKRSYKKFLDWSELQNQKGNEVSTMVCGRAIGIMLSLELSAHPFIDNEGYKTIEHLPLAARVERMREPDMKQRILRAESERDANERPNIANNYKYVFVLGASPDYEQTEADSIESKARAQGISPAELAYDILLQDDGRAMLYSTFLNYADYNLDAALEMMTHENTVLGLGDGGAHVGMICDASFTTSMLTHWTRDRERGEKLTLPWVIRAQTHETAKAYGLLDRGLIKPGYKADINIIDYENLSLEHPTVAYDLPAGGKRLAQSAKGYDATIVSGVVIQQKGQPTGALPGRLIRGAQRTPHMA